MVDTRMASPDHPAGDGLAPNPLHTPRRRRLSGAGRILRAVTRNWAPAFVVLLLFVAVFGPQMVPHGINEVDSTQLLAGSSMNHLLGTDGLGRDVFSRLLVGARSMVLGTMLAVAIAIVLGLAWGVAAAFGGSMVGEVLMRLADAALSFPAFVLAIAIIGATGPGLTNAMVAIGIIFAPILARLSRSEILRVQGRDFVVYARAYGMRPLTNARVHLLPNIMPPIIVQVTILSGLAVIAQAALSFLALGAQPPSANWGSMLGDAFHYIYQAPWQMLPPGIAIVLTVLAINSIGDRLRMWVER